MACKFRDGVLIATDTLGSYGSLARFTDLRRVVKANRTTLIAYDGEVSDFQEIEFFLQESNQTDLFHGDGLSWGPKDTLTYFTRLLYRARSKMNPLWNNLVVGGWDEQDQRVYLGTTDMIGTMYEEDVIATGMGMHMALPILRAAWKPDLTEEQARELVLKCMTVLLYRDCYTLNNISIGVVKSDGTIKVEDPIKLKTEWSFQAFVKPPM